MLAINAFLARHRRVAIVVGVLVAILVVLAAAHGIVDHAHGGPGHGDHGGDLGPAGDCALGLCVALPLLLIALRLVPPAATWRLVGVIAARARGTLPRPPRARVGRSPSPLVLCRLQT